MQIAIHQSVDRKAQSKAEGWADCLLEKGIDVCWVDLTKPFQMSQVEHVDGIMWSSGNAIDRQIVYRNILSIEMCFGTSVFPDHRMLWHGSDKLSQYSLLKTAGAPMPATWIFWDKQEALSWALQANYPKVFKLSSGGRCKDIYLVRSVEQACHIINLMFGMGIYRGGKYSNPSTTLARGWSQLVDASRRGKHAALSIMGSVIKQPALESGYVYFQEYLPENDYKTCVTVSGDKAYSYLRFNGSDGFRSNGEKHDLAPESVDKRCIELAFELSDHMKLCYMAYDFLMDNGKPSVIEISPRFKKYQGYWAKDLTWCNADVSRVQAEVEAFLWHIARAR